MILAMRRSEELEGAKEVSIEVSFFAAGSFDIDPGRHSILCVGRGSAFLEFAGRTVTLQEGELLLTGSQGGVESIVALQGEATESAVLSFCRDSIVEQSSLAESMEYLRDFEAPTGSTAVTVSVPKNVLEEIVELMRRIGKESESRGKYSFLAMKTYLKMILILLCRERGERANTLPVQPRDAVRLQPLFLYLAQHYMEAIPVDQAAQVLNMSNSHFMRYFRQATGSAFVPYLNRLRISKAQALIGQSRLSITQVGEAVGFCDHSYFSSIFRRFSGVGPREYRNRLRKGGREEAGL